MYRPKQRRRSGLRILGLALVAAAYLATLVWASDITAVEAAASMRDAVVTAGNAASTQVTAATTQVTAATAATASALEAAPHEAPMVTLVIAGGLLLAGGSWYLVRVLRRHRRVARRARLVVRYLTALI